MRLWRISNYADLTGMGGVRYGARWHSKGRPILYTAEHPAGALVEFLAHLDLEDIPVNFQLMTIGTGSHSDPPVIAPQSLATDWTTNRSQTRAVGDLWLREGKTLLLRVPSVLVPDSFNVLINPAHPDAVSLTIHKIEKIPLDPRFRRS